MQNHNWRKKEAQGMQKLTTAMKTSGAVEIYQRLREISGGKVLDVGTSQGGFIDTLMKSLKDYDSFIGIDISQKDLEKARSRFTDKPVEFDIMNAESMGFEDETFDMVSMSYCIHHLKNPKIVLDEIKRVLKQNGYLIIEECFCDGDQDESKQTDIMLHSLNIKIDTLRGENHYEILSRKQLKDLVMSMKLSDIESYESKRFVKCLFCEDMEECDDPKNKDNVDFHLKDMDDMLKAMIDHPQYKELCQEADSLRKRVRATGVMPASHLFFVCRKRKSKS
jgi:ubiquinone/menaquinone biosynthesis C-methylase UbiE